MEKDKDLHEQIEELNKRIAELEDQISGLVRPIQDMQSNTKKYFKILDLVLRHGKISPDMLMPEIKDPIAKDIICVLVERGYQNISQITIGVKAKRGSASRRIIRKRLEMLEEKGIISKNDEKKVSTFYISEEVLRKWSQILGIAI
ncbi:MAG: hypothetical protein JW825_00890 [Candidatus Methanofastidiosa archaeon]|nr:hypothetical protein [Candidatus Methanofastidiosa archaeon]